MNFYWKNDLDLTRVASPGLLVDADRVENNLQRMISIAGNDPSRLRPHVKTHKMSSVVRLQIAKGINRFKTATLAEAEMVANAGGRDVLLAYQMVGPNVQRFAELIDRFPETRFSTVVDSPAAVAGLSKVFATGTVPIDLWIDVDCGMHRTGVPIGPKLDEIRDRIEASPELRFGGLHVYDGHLHDPPETDRREKVSLIIDAVREYNQRRPCPMVVGGGSPTFPFWAGCVDWQCSPGTTVFWDVGYGSSYADLQFQVAIALVARVISKPGEDRICLDLGYKSMAAEMPLGNRIQIPGIPDAQLLGQSEEHLMLGTASADAIPLGAEFLAYPRHVCPTIALHGFATVVRDGRVTSERWEVDARARDLLH